MRAFAIVLLLGAFCVALIGLLFLSNATSGVGILCLACLLAISARVAQASAHHAEMRASIERLRPAVPAPLPASVPKPAPPMTDIAEAAKFYGVSNAADRPLDRDRHGS